MQHGLAWLKMMALLLNNKELCVCDFEKVLEITHSKASRHLRNLFHAGLVQDRREGLWIYYKITKKLSKDGKILLESLRTLLLDRERYVELEKRLNQWLKEKATMDHFCK